MMETIMKPAGNHKSVLWNDYRIFFPKITSVTWLTIDVFRYTVKEREGLEQILNL